MVSLMSSSFSTSSPALATAFLTACFTPVAWDTGHVHQGFARQLPDEIQVASAYLRCYGEVAQERWRELGVALDAFPDADRDGDRVIEAARDGFLRLHAWVRPAVQPRPSRIHA